MDANMDSKIAAEALAEGAEAVRVVDKRGQAREVDPTPTAREMTPEETQDLIDQQVREEQERAQTGHSSYTGGGGMQGEHSAPEKVSCVTAFVVMLGHDGVAMATGNLDAALTLDPQRGASASDLLKCCYEVVSDIQAGNAAMAVVNHLAGMQQQQQAAATQQRSRVQGVRG